MTKRRRKTEAELYEEEIEKRIDDLEFFLNYSLNPIPIIDDFINSELNVWCIDVVDLFRPEKEAKKIRKMLNELSPLDAIIFDYYRKIALSEKIRRSMIEGDPNQKS